MTVYMHTLKCLKRIKQHIFVIYMKIEAPYKCVFYLLWNKVSLICFAPILDCPIQIIRYMIVFVS